MNNHIKRFLFKYVFTFKIFMRPFALFILFFFTYATMAYFQETLLNQFNIVKNYINYSISSNDIKNISWLIAGLISIGLLMESGPVIWNKIIAWGQIIDNFILKIFYQRTYFLDDVEQLLNESAQLRRKINLHLQKIIIHQNKMAEPKQKDKLQRMIKKISFKCKKANRLLRLNTAMDTPNIKRQTLAKKNVNELVEANLFFADKLSELNNNIVMLKNKKNINL